MKKLENLRWRPRWTSHLACMKGCVDYLGLELTDAWLFGCTGHAFVMNIHPLICPSGPTAWNNAMLFRLAPNLGFFIEAETGHSSQDDFADIQANAFQLVKRSIDSNLPCYGWELEIPEYYLIHGYNNEGYFYRGPNVEREAGPKPWRSLGNSEIGWLEVFAVRPGYPVDARTAVKVALAFVVQLEQNPGEWSYKHYQMGLAAYDQWIAALEDERSGGFGMAYNAAVWSECRSYAKEFLMEARDRLGASTAFNQAVAHFSVVANKLAALARLFPFDKDDVPAMEETFGNSTRRDDAKGLLETARAAEQKGIVALQELAGSL